MNIGFVWNQVHVTFDVHVVVVAIIVRHLLSRR